MNPIADIFGFFCILTWLIGQTFTVVGAYNRLLSVVIKAVGIMLLSLLGAWYSGMLLRPGVALIYSAVVCFVGAACWAVSAKISDMKQAGHSST